MNYSDMDEETREKRKKEQIAFRTKKRNSTRFMLFCSLFEIVETVLIMFVLFVVSAFFVFKVFHLSDQTAQTVVSILLIVIFLGGMILGFLIYKKFVRWYIKKFHMENKLSDEVLIHYFREEELESKKEELRR